MRLKTTQQMLLGQQARHFSRYLNRGQQAALDMKSDLSAYNQLPQQIARIVPGPEYPEKAMPNRDQVMKRKNSQYDLERIRTSAITRIEKERKYITGRIHAHKKLEQIRQDVAKIRNTEATAGLKTVSTGIIAPDIQIDDQFQLPYGAGFDKVIKKMAENIDSQKQSNNLAMDQLVMSLGYMDYRDALACNKYIIEAKRSGDYHQMARGRILQTAMARLKMNRRDELEREAHRKASAVATPGSEAYTNFSEDYKLNQLMDINPEVSELYRDTMTQIRLDKESDYNNLTRIHNRFDYFKDPDNMLNKQKSKYDLEDKAYNSDEDAITASEFSDPEEQLLYVRYKIMKNMNKNATEDTEKKAREIKLKYEKAVKDAKKGHSFEIPTLHIHEDIAQYNKIKVEREKLSKGLEQVIASLRLVHELKKLDIMRILSDNDPNLHESFTPF